MKRDVYAVSGAVAIVKSLFASVYRETSITKHQPLLTLPFEARLEVSLSRRKRRRWIQVRLPDQREGWIQRGDVTLEATTHVQEEMLMFSRRFLGLPYQWGGTSTFGYDCSGFTQMLLRQTGEVHASRCTAAGRVVGCQTGFKGRVAARRSALLRFF